MEPKEFKPIEIPEPKGGQNLVKVKILRITVCGSDLHVYRGRRPHPPFPLVVGKPAHECLGRAMAKDPRGRFEKGEIVVVRPPQSDGLKEFMAIPSEHLYPVKPYGLEEELDEAVLASLIAPVVRCARILGNVVGKSVFIIGQGPAGLMHTEMVRRMGARFVGAADLLEYRLEESRKRGADATVNASSDDVVEAGRELTGGDLFDIVIEAVGSAQTIEMAPMLARPEGMVVFYGLPGEDAFLRPYRYFSKRLLMRTSEFPEKRDFELALKMIAEGEIDLKSMITHVLGFGEVPRAFELADEKEERVLRVVISVD